MNRVKNNVKSFLETMLVGFAFLFGGCAAQHTDIKQGSTTLSQSRTEKAATITEENRVIRHPDGSIENVHSVEHSGPQSTDSANAEATGSGVSTNAAEVAAKYDGQPATLELPGGAKARGSSMDGSITAKGLQDLFKNPFAWVAVLFTIGGVVSLVYGLRILAIGCGGIAGIMFVACLAPGLFVAAIVVCFVILGLMAFFNTHAGEKYKQALRTTLAVQKPKSPTFMADLSQHAEEVEINTVRKLLHKDRIS